MSNNTKPPSAEPGSSVKYNRDGTVCKLVKRSKIWETFRTIPEDPGKAICIVCNGVISRGGGTKKSQCTTNLWKHVENKHHDVFKQLSKHKEIVNRAEKVYRHPENSKAWELFSVDVGDPTIIRCLECDVEILHTTNDNTPDLLWYHVMNEHPALYDKCVNEAIAESNVLNRKGKRSSVWSEFTQHPVDVCKVVCNTCDMVVSRGTSKNQLNTTNMRRHLISSGHVNVAKSKGQETDGVAYDDEVECGNDSLSKRFLIATPNNNDEAPIGDVDLNLKHQTPIEAQYFLTQRPVDLFHTGLLGYALYEQHKRGICCDFAIVIQSGRALPNTEGNARFTPESSETFKIHNCVASFASEKMRKVIESGQSHLKLANISKNIVQYFIEIIYTGKINMNHSLETRDVHQLYKLAKRLGADTVSGYIQRTYPIEMPYPIFPNENVPTVTDKALLAESSCQHIVGNARIAAETPVHLPKLNKRKNYIPHSAGDSSKIAKKIV